MTFLLITDEVERDRIIQEIDAAYGYPHPETKTDHAVMWTETAAGEWLIPIPDDDIYSPTISGYKPLLDEIPAVVPDAGIAADSQPVKLSAQLQTEAASQVVPEGQTPPPLPKVRWIDPLDAVLVATGDLTVPVGPVGGGTVVSP